MRQQAIIAEVVKQAMKEATDKICTEFEAKANASAAPPPLVATAASLGTSGATVYENFDWTRDKIIYQQWQVWSIQAKHILETMEGH